jgi:putative intracellular protease/amidase
VDPVRLPPSANGGDAQRAEELRRYIDEFPDLTHPARLEDVSERAGDVDAVFIPGDHAPMEDPPAVRRWVGC